MTSQAIIFDIGNVLVRWDPRFLYRQLIPDPDALEYFLSHVVTLEWHSRHDAGLSFAAGIAERAREFPEHAALIRAFKTRWDETIGGAIDGSVALVEQLALTGRALYALTNFSAETYPNFAREYRFMRHFRDVLVSGEVGLIKPDPRIYALASQRFGLIGERPLFIDDRAENVEAARNAGWDGVVFTDPEALRAALVARGLL